jgi:hypothetical protein
MSVQVAADDWSARLVMLRGWRVSRACVSGGLMRRGWRRVPVRHGLSQAAAPHAAHVSVGVARTAAPATAAPAVFQAAPSLAVAYAVLGWTILRWTVSFMAGFLVMLFLLDPRLDGGQASGNDIAGIYLQVQGTVYAVVLAFVVFVVWDQFNDARRNLEHEANEIMDLVRLARHAPFAPLGPDASPIERQLETYVAAVLTEEMPPAAQAASPRAEQALLAIWQTLMAVEPTTARAQVLLNEAIERFEELADLRSYRLLSADQRLPWGVRWVVLLGGALTVGSMGLFSGSSFWPLCAMALFLALTIASVLAVVIDLDDPFGGALRVPNRSLQLALRALAAPAQPAPAEQS